MLAEFVAALGTRGGRDRAPLLRPADGKLGVSRPQLPSSVRVMALRVSSSSSSARLRSAADTARSAASGVRVAASSAARRSSSFRNDAVTPSVRASTSSRP